MDEYEYLAHCAILLIVPTENKWYNLVLTIARPSVVPFTRLWRDYRQTEEAPLYVVFICIEMLIMLLYCRILFLLSDAPPSVPTITVTPPEEDLQADSGSSKTDSYSPQASTSKAAKLSSQQVHSPSQMKSPRSKQNKTLSKKNQ